MMSVFLTEEIERKYPDNDDTILSYFFCSHQDENRNTGVAVLRTLLYQILTKRPRLAKHALSYFESTEGTQDTIASLETLWVIFRGLINDPELGTMFCLIDGLDECDEVSRKFLLERLAEFLIQSPVTPPAGFRLAIASRNVSGLQGSTRVSLDLGKNEETVSDVKHFISTRVKELSRLEGFDD